MSKKPTIEKIDEKYTIVPYLNTQQVLHTEPLVVKRKDKNDDSIVDEIYEGMMVVTIHIKKTSMGTNDIPVKIDEADIYVKSFTRSINLKIDKVEFTKGDTQYDYFINLKLSVSDTNNKVVSAKIEMPEQGVLCKNNALNDVHVTLDPDLRPGSNELILSGNQICKFRWRI